jgi:predicted DNA-binding protein (MmcQ/YjbR family)
VTLEMLRRICVALPGVTEDVKWGHDLCFCVGGKMFVVVNLDPPHQMAFKCTPDTFAELTEREGVIPAPYMARNMWVQERELGETLERRELEPLIKVSYELVVAKLPKSRRPSTTASLKSRAAPVKRAKTRKRQRPSRSG